MSSASRPEFDYFVIGPRMGLLTPIALEESGLLSRLHTDACLLPGLLTQGLQSLLGPRTAGRVVVRIPKAKIRRHPDLFALARLRRRRALAGRDTGLIDQLLIRSFVSVARQCSSAAVMGVQSSCLELFEGRHYRVMEQVSPPLRYERRLVASEQGRFPGWAVDRMTMISEWDYRMEAEWSEAEVICVPSSHLVSLSAEFGADPAKFRVIPYPLPSACGSSARSVRRKTGDRLRVVFAGTLMLEKGVQYIWEALHGWSSPAIDMHFFGPSQLTPFGMQCLSEVGTVHGPVPRSTLLGEFQRADLLLFPSLSEGSALVTGEAVAVGLPVVATRESGAPDAAIVIDARSPDGIRSALERIMDDPTLLEQQSQVGLAEASQRTVTAYTEEVAKLANEAPPP